MTPDLLRFTQTARIDPKLKMTSIMGLLCRPEGLADSFGRLATNKAAGVDGMKKADYEVGLDGRLADLSGQLRRAGYMPKPVRRVYIPKASGAGRRPLGIPAFEDRIVQDRASQILQAIWEPEFLDCSFGFRPGKSAHDALRRVDQIVMRERTQWCVEADIKGFFNQSSGFSRPVSWRTVL
jgi:RNA-directed DNA polymerase